MGCPASCVPPTIRSGIAPFRQSPMTSKNDKQVKLQCTEVQLCRLLESSDVVLKEYVDGVAIFTHKKYINRHIKYTLTGKRPAKVATAKPDVTTTGKTLDENLNSLRTASQEIVKKPDPDYLPPPQQHDLLFDPYKHMPTGKCKNNKNWKNVLERCCDDPECENWFIKPPFLHSICKEPVYENGVENVNTHAFTAREFRSHKEFDFLSDTFYDEQMKKREDFCKNNKIPFRVKSSKQGDLPPKEFKKPAMFNNVPYYSRSCHEEHPIRYLTGCKFNFKALAASILNQPRPDISMTKRLLEHLKDNVQRWNQCIRSYSGFIPISTELLCANDYENDQQGLLRFTKELQEFWIVIQTYDPADVLECVNLLPESFKKHNHYVDQMIGHMKRQKLIR